MAKTLSFLLLLMSVPLMKQDTFLNQNWSPITPQPVSWQSGPQSYSTTGHGAVGGTIEYDVNLPDPALQFNCGVVGLTVGDLNSATITVTDDKSDTFTEQKSVTDSTNGTLSQLWTGSLTVGAREIRVEFSKITTSVSAVAIQFAGTSCVVDGTPSGNNGTGTTITAGSITPTVSGDLFFQYVDNDSDYTVSHFTQGSQSNITWKKLSSDTSQGNSGNCPGAGPPYDQNTCLENPVATQWGIYNSTSALNPTMSQTGGTTNTYISLAVALKAANTGTLLSSRINIIGIQNEEILYNVDAVSPTIDFPCTGDLIVGTWIAGGNSTSSYVAPTAISDSINGSWTQGKSTVVTDGNNAQVWYFPNASCGQTLTVTITFQSGVCTFGQGCWGDMLFYDIKNATSSPYDSSGSSTNTGQQGTSGGSASYGPITAFSSISPSQARELVLTNIAVDCNLINGLSGTGQLYDAVTIVNESYSCGSGPPDYTGADDTAYVDFNNGWGHYYTTSTSGVTVTWTEYGEVDAGYWAAALAAFKSQ